ncbi:DUF4199 domain-containing protein [Zhouia spongiae]|uniref:DUF4199 domain-containing protein n=1 Tax=Zhouia spongiae TaxID=2202721 RepID=A0ABY3YKF3_9FLAO|nr:DUF4199 domain-containing protein [Zhouia spongiae]UNY98307.1 DUF4199 domain-containing protein [Zhouia spongiae]
MKQREIVSINGFLLGVFNIILLLVVYYLDIKIMVDYNLSCVLIMLLGSIVLGVISINSMKKTLNGYISFEKAFVIFILTVLIGTIMNLLFTYALFNIIDLDAGIIAKERIYESTLDNLENYNLPRNVIREELNKVEKIIYFGFIELFKASGIFLIVSSVFGVIVSLIMKQKIED